MTLAALVAHSLGAPVSAGAGDAARKRAEPAQRGQNRLDVAFHHRIGQSRGGLLSRRNRLREHYGFAVVFSPYPLTCPVIRGWRFSRRHDCYDFLCRTACPPKRDTPRPRISLGP